MEPLRGCFTKKNTFSRYICTYTTHVSYVWSENLLNFTRILDSPLSKQNCFCFWITFSLLCRFVFMAELLALVYTYAAVHTYAQSCWPRPHSDEQKSKHFSKSNNGTCSSLQMSSAYCLMGGKLFSVKKNKAFIFLKYAQWQWILSFDNSTALYKDPKTSHPGWIRTRYLLFWKRTRWPMCHAAPGHGWKFF
jgi:hypothetical protein